MSEVAFSLHNAIALTCDGIADAAERHARAMDAQQYQARIAELERQVAELTAWKDAVPVDDLRQLFGDTIVPYLEYRRRMDKVNAWFDSLIAQDAANNAAMALWDKTH